MSVEEAREALNDAIALWHQTRDRRDSAAIDVAEDRLILEVQAECGCETCGDNTCDRGCDCLTCTARKQLTKVTA